MGEQPEQLDVVEGRRSVYGEVIPTFTRIAQMWSAILDHEVAAHEVALCMDAFKTIRATQAPDYSDNVDDKDGYMRIFRELIGSDMIEARSVEDYLAKKFPPVKWEPGPLIAVPDTTHKVWCMHCDALQPETGSVHKHGCPALGRTI